jgi:hypothetical protein
VDRGGLFRSYFADIDLRLSTFLSVLQGFQVLREAGIDLRLSTFLSVLQRFQVLRGAKIDLRLSTFVLLRPKRKIASIAGRR